jgi:hypothetical protein
MPSIKKHFCIAVFMAVVVMTALSQSLLINVDYMFGELYIVKDNILYHYDESTGEKETITDFAVGVNDNGFLYLDAKGSHFLYVPNYPFTELDCLRVHNDKYALPNQNGGIIAITESSFFSEMTSKGKIEYRASGLLKRFCREAESPFIWNDDSYPWVEGKYGTGEGEELTITFEKPSDCVSILGGYVDFDRQYLFRQNCRPKQIRISSKSGNFSIIKDIEDKVYFAEIELPQKVSDLTIEILKVYPGNKYADLCISAIFAYQKENRPKLDINEIIRQFR